jgi:ACS family glucarate transporter-like MFS transporter
MSLRNTANTTSTESPGRLPSAAAALGPIGHRRYLIAAGLGIIACLGYMDRVNFSVAGASLIKEFHLTTGEFGLATSIFSWAYVVFLIPFGILADKRGSRLALPLAIIVWSLGAGLTGASVGFGTLIVARLLLGAGEAPVFPAGNTVVREWAPAKERGVFTGTLNAGTVVGPAIGAVVAAYLVFGLGWRGSFFVEGLFGIAVGIIWYLLYHKPQDAKWLSAKERDFILANREDTLTGSRTATAMSVWSMLRTRSIWGLMLAQGAAIYTSYMFLSFLPLFLETQRHLQVLSSGWATGLTYGIAAVGSVVVARFSDRLLKRSDVLKGGRRKAVALVMLLTLPMLALPFATSVPLLIVLVSWVLIMDTAAITLNWTLASDLIADKASTARAFALVGVGGNVFGLLAPIVTGYLVGGTGNYDVPFIVAAGLLVAGAVITFTMSTRVLQPRTIADSEAEAR